IESDFDRQGGFSSAYLRASGPIADDALTDRVTDDQRLKLEGFHETDHYAKQTSSGAPIKVIGCGGGCIMAVGAGFVGMDALYAVLFALLMGCVGGLAPAWHAARQNILNAVRS